MLQFSWSLRDGLKIEFYLPQLTIAKKIAACRFYRDALRA